uniref:Pyroglutamylated RFamide peptide n=1 Tax=Bos mutus grunniens TaxID=30521 RepID=A0A8B9WZU2_BOSMU
TPLLLPYLLFLPLGACFPVLDTEEPVDAEGHRTEMSWMDLPCTPHALLVTAKELRAPGKARAGFQLRLGRQDDGSEATGLLGEAEKVGGLLGTLAEELNGYSRKKGGFSFRFGRG